MKVILPNFLVCCGLLFLVVACANVQSKSTSDNLDTSPDLPKNTFTDLRDGATYSTVAIGWQIWMAENLRFKADGSRLNPENPSKEYGRLYSPISAQTACPEGWHLPTDMEWSTMEMTLGMSRNGMMDTFWRGEHGGKLKSKTGWIEEGNGSNDSGFNGYPAGYYLWDGEKPEFGGLGGSVGYWTAAEGEKAWIRFLASPKKGVNRFDDDLGSGFSIACRCVKD